MVTVVEFIDIYPLRYWEGGLQVLTLRRGPGVRCTGSWEVVHGHIEPGERPVDAAVRELEEESGLAPARLYNLSRVESFYLHKTDQVAVIPVFVAFVVDRPVRLSHEHDASAWLRLDAAKARLAWPRECRALDDVGMLFAHGDAGLLEDVLRIS
jgi:8-oxo-dGTP pyrophosphatase MutT (NUDIX family)